MKSRIFRLSSIMLTVLTCMLFLTSCGINEKYAEKINKAAEDEKYITYEEVVKKIGEKNIVDITVALGKSRSGVVIAVKGCTTSEEVQAKLDKGETVKGIVIVILDNKATSASYKELTESDLK